MSATNIIDTAPLGAFNRYTDSRPKPPARFTKCPLERIGPDRIRDSQGFLSVIPFCRGRYGVKNG